jgi:hypothetical protein
MMMMIRSVMMPALVRSVSFLVQSG